MIGFPFLWVLVPLFLQAAEPRPDEQRWTDLRYMGGAPRIAKSKSESPATLAVSDRIVELRLNGGEVIAIEPRRITGLSYGNEMHGRATSWFFGLAGFGGVAAGSVFNEAAKAKTHFVGIEYTLPDGNRSAVLLRAQKGNFKAILDALLKLTGLAEIKNDAVACGPPEEKHEVRTVKSSAAQSEPAPGKALIYVIRRHKGNEGWLTKRQIKLAANGRWVGINQRKNSYFSFEADPGLLRLCSKAGNTSPFYLWVESGRTYYLEQMATVFRDASMWHSGTDIVELDRQEGTKAVAKSRLSTFKVRVAAPPPSLRPARR